MPSTTLRTFLRFTRYVVVALAALVVLFLAAWLPFNVRDAAPRPLPAALAVPPQRVADEHNAAYAVHALLAAADRDATVTGRAAWAAERAFAEMPAEKRSSEAADARTQKVKDLMGTPVAAPKGAPLTCEGKRDTCDDVWLAQAEALARQRSTYGVIGERCDRLVADGVEFEELQPPALRFDATLMSWGGIGHCARWFRSGAIVALAQGRREEALAQLQAALKLQQMTWQGARTLIGFMVSSRIARGIFDTVATVVLREPALAEPLAARLQGPIDTRSAARLWMPMEAQVTRAAIDDVRSAAILAHEGSTFALGWAGDWLIAHGIGMLREQTKQKLEDAWLRRIGNLDGDWRAILAAEVVEHEEARADAQPHWRNTFGEWLVTGARADWGTYLARLADHELNREALGVVLALQRQRVPAGERAEATRKMALTPVLKDRLGWSSDGLTMTVRTWQSEPPASGFDSVRDAIKFTWPG